MAPVGPCKPAERAALRVQPLLCHQQARAPAAIDEPQAQASAALPFAKGDPAAAQRLVCGGHGDRQPKAVFRVDQRAGVMPADDDRGIPGQAHNCRCFAEPVTPGSRTEVILAELALPVEAPLDAILRRLGLRAVAITPLGTAALAALAASDALQQFTRLATERRLQRAAEILGVDPGSAEGLLAAMAHELVQEAVISGLGSSLPKSVEAAQIAGQAAALYEMLNPGTIVRVLEGDRAAQLALGDFVQRAYNVFAEGRLRLQDGTIAQGWVEVFPELTEGERRLGELPGFTPERIDEWLETYPAEVLGLPNHTGSPAAEDPTGNIISTPIPDTTGPNIVTMENPHSIDSVSIPEDRARHILDGEGRSGGHRYGTGTPGKTEFPASWSDDDILEAIRQVAGTGTVDRPAHRGGDLVVVGEVNGVTIEVVVQPNGEVRTGYPLSGPGVRRN